MGEGLLHVWPVTRSVTISLTSNVSVVPLRLRRNTVLRFVGHIAMRGTHETRSPGRDPATAHGWKLVSYGRLNTAWPPTRRQRQRRSSSTVMSSKVARPSGPANDQVISSTPGALRTGFTRNAEGQGVDGSAA